MVAADVRAVGVSAAASAAWYTAFERQLARFDEAYAEGSHTPAWVMPVELACRTAVAAAVAALADRTRTQGAAEAARLGLELWGAFPVVLLTGLVVHEKVPWQQAAIHAGDWLVKLLLVSALVGRRRGRRPPVTGARRRSRRAAQALSACHPARAGDPASDLG